MRAKGDRTPVILLTAKDGIEDRVTGLDAGELNIAAGSSTILYLLPKIVAAFMRATAKGWEYALDNKEETVKAVVALNAELDSEQQSRQLAMQEDFIRSEFTKTNGLCAVDPAAVEAGAATLHEFAGLDVNFDPKAITHSEFNAAASK